MDTRSHTKLEEAVVSRLKSKAFFNDVEVVRTPDTDKEYNTPFMKPRVTVMFTQSEYSDESSLKGFPKSMSTAEVVQTEFAEITINIQSRTRQGHKGIFNVYENCRRALLGYKPVNWSRFFVKTFSFVDHKENVWYYALVLVTSSLIIMCNEDEDVLQNSDNSGLIENGDGTPLVEVNFK